MLHANVQQQDQQHDRYAGNQIYGRTDPVRRRESCHDPEGNEHLKCIYILNRRIRFRFMLNLRKTKKYRGAEHIPVFYIKRYMHFYLFNSAIPLPEACRLLPLCS